MQIGLERTDRLVIGVRDEVALHRLLAGDLADARHRSAPEKRGKSRSRGFYYNNPRSAKDSAWLPATMKWSRTLTSTRARASFSVRVSSSSAWLGWATPEG